MAAANPINAKVDPQLRFALIEDEDLFNLLEDADSKNTKRQIKYSVNVLSQYVQTRLGGNCTVAVVEGMSAAELDECLSKFYPALRKENGELYTKKSMQGIRYGLQRHFQQLRGFDIVKNAEFSESNKSFKAMLVKLKKEGLGFVEHKSVIPKKDFAKIQASDALDMSTPRGLQNKVFVDVMLFLCNRGQENLRSMKETDFIVSTDEDGLRSITHKDMLTKNNREKSDEITGGMMYEVTGNERCPVKSFIEYTSKLNPDCSAFWQRPKEKVPDGLHETWYCNSPVGINTLNKKVKEISTEAGCSKIYTNHCLRATCVTVLDQGGFQNRDIMTVSGHHSEQSIKHYSRTSEEKKRQMSAMIARKAIEHKPSTSTSSPSLPRPTPTMSTPVNQQPSNGPNAKPTLGVNLQSPEPSASTVQTRPSPKPSSLDNLVVLTDSQEQNILQEIDINNAFSMTASSHQTLNFHGCTVNFYNSHQ